MSRNVPAVSRPLWSSSLVMGPIAEFAPDVGVRLGAALRPRHKHILNDEALVPRTLAASFRAILQANLDGVHHTSDIFAIKIKFDEQGLEDTRDKIA